MLSDHKQAAFDTTINKISAAHSAPLILDYTQDKHDEDFSNSRSLRLPDFRCLAQKREPVG